MPNDLDLGECCICHGRRNVRNIIMHPKLAPRLGTGWGCAVCGLPLDGAISVLCDDCVPNSEEVSEVCVGYPKENQRVTLASLAPGTFDHDMRFHQDEVA